MPQRQTRTARCNAGYAQHEDAWDHHKVSLAHVHAAVSSTGALVSPCASSLSQPMVIMVAIAVCCQRPVPAAAPARALYTRCAMAHAHMKYMRSHWPQRATASGPYAAGRPPWTV